MSMILWDIMLMLPAYQIEWGLILGLHPANERCLYKVILSFIGWALQSDTVFHWLGANLDSALTDMLHMKPDAADHLAKT